MYTIKLLKNRLCFKGLLLTSITYIDFFVEEALCIKSWVEKKRAVAEVMTDK